MQWQTQHEYSSAPLTGAGSATPSVSLAALDASHAAVAGVQPQRPNGGQRLVLVDAFALLYRVHHGFKPEHRLRTSEGLDTTIVYGFLKILLAVMEQAPPPTHLAVVFDSGSGGLKGKTFRHEIYAGYKGHRQRMPEEIAWALPPLTLLLEQMRIPTFKVPGLEADDIIATLAVKSVDAGFLVEIASPDKDFNQILRPGLELLRPATSKTKKGETFNRFNCDSFREAFDLEPHQFADVLALMGDASDNVPGVKGVGEKISIALLKEYGDLDNVLANADKVSRKQVRETLLSDDGIAAARLSSRLVKLQTDIDVPDLRVPLDTMRLQLPDEINRTNALGLLRELELKTHADRLQALYDGALRS